MIVLATGGTGGHVFPALAVAEEARARGVEVTILGERGGLEERLAAEAEVPFVGVSAGKWHRGRPSPAHAVRAAAGVMEAWRYLRRARPAAVVGFGGFASFPGAVAASRLKIPLVLHEGNAFPSKVNRWLARSAELVIAAQDEALAHLGPVKRQLVIPFPVREGRVDRSAARAALGLSSARSEAIGDAGSADEPPVTLVMGGSQGSAALNRAVPAAFGELAADGARPTEVLHAAGRGRTAEVQAPLTDYLVREFVDAPQAWAAADLAITRAGMGTLAEAALNAVPLIMVPLPSSAEDHQLHNARAVEAAGAGLVVEERELSAGVEPLVRAWRRLLEPAFRQRAAAAAAARTPAGAPRRILDAVMELT